MFSQVNIQVQDSMQLKVTMQWNQNIKNRNEKTLTNGSDINTLVSTQYPGQHSQSLRSELVSLPGQALATQTLSIKGREERVKGDGSDVIICVFTRDHVEESLLRRACRFPGEAFQHIHAERVTNNTELRKQIDWSISSEEWILGQEYCTKFSRTADWWWLIRL